jgi:hypothetical protein
VVAKEERIDGITAQARFAELLKALKPLLNIVCCVIIESKKHLVLLLGYNHDSRHSFLMN